MVTTNPIAAIFQQLSLQNDPDRYAIILYKNLYEIQSSGGPLYTSIRDVSEEDKQGLNLELLDRAIQIMNTDDDIDTIVELYEKYFSEENEQNGGKRRTRSKRSTTRKSKYNVSKKRRRSKSFRSKA